MSRLEGANTTAERRWWDGAIFLIGVPYVGTVLALSSLRSWSESLLPADPAAFVAWFSPLDALRDLASLPLGIALAAFLGIALFREGPLRTRRAALRGLALLLLFAIALVHGAAMDPIVEEILGDPMPTGAALDVLIAQLSPWSWTTNGLALGMLVALGLAHRAPTAELTTPASGITDRHRRVLFLVGTATFFHGYDTFIATLALPYIGRDLGAGEGALGFALAVIRLGALASVLTGRVSDRYGRRRLLILSVVAYTLATAATAFSRGLVDFAIYQLVASVFLTTEIVLAQVVIAEEFPDAARGHGQGLLGAFTGLGAATAALLFPAFQESDLGWRGMYLVGLIPLTIVAFLRRNLQESSRWTDSQALRERRGQLAELLKPRFRGRLLALSVLAFSGPAAIGAAFAFASHYVTTHYGWSPGRVSILILGGGAFGFGANFVVGRLADRFGRRRVGFLGLVLTSVGVILFYQGERFLFPAFALITFMETASGVAGTALFTETFPTRLRATARSCGTTCGVVGGLAGLSTVGAFSAAAGGANIVITGLAVLGLVVSPVWFLIPETANTNLDRLDEPLEPQAEER
jgi:putative MFS transporter